MQDSIYDVIERCAAASNNGTAHFGEIVAALLEAGVESYFADYRAGTTTYYLPDDSCLSLDLPDDDTEIASEFDADGIKAAIRGAQRGEVMYPQFKQLSQAAGCVGYIVWLTGRQVTYFGRHGETHVEQFPNQ